MSGSLTDKKILSCIHHFRGYNVMLDADLAELYGVETRVLNQAVKRNISRFPEDFMFQLTKEEMEFLISQSVTSSWGGVRKCPYVFTENGVAMLSSEKAIKVNIQIMRIFTQVRQMLASHDDLKKKIEHMEKSTISSSKTFLMRSSGFFMKMKSLKEELGLKIQRKNEYSFILLNTINEV